MARLISQQEMQLAADLSRMLSAEDMISAVRSTIIDNLGIEESDEEVIIPRRCVPDAFWRALGTSLVYGQGRRSPGFLDAPEYERSVELDVTVFELILMALVKLLEWILGGRKVPPTAPSQNNHKGLDSSDLLPSR